MARTELLRSFALACALSAGVFGCSGDDSAGADLDSPGGEVTSTTSQAAAPSSTTTASIAEPAVRVVGAAPAQRRISWTVGAPTTGWIGYEEETDTLLRSIDGIEWQEIQTEQRWFGSSGGFRIGDSYVISTSNASLGAVQTRDFARFSDGPPDEMQPSVEERLQLLSASQQSILYRPVTTAGATTLLASSEIEPWLCEDAPTNVVVAVVDGQEHVVMVPAGLNLVEATSDGFAFLDIWPDSGDAACDDGQDARRGVWTWSPGAGYEFVHQLDFEAGDFGLLPGIRVTADGRIVVNSTDGIHISDPSDRHASWTTLVGPDGSTWYDTSPDGRTFVATEGPGQRLWVWSGDTWLEVPIEGHSLPLPIASAPGVLILGDVGELSPRVRTRIEFG